jgi:hypothetical protein
MKCQQQLMFGILNITLNYKYMMFSTRGLKFEIAATTTNTNNNNNNNNFGYRCGVRLFLLLTTF